MVQVLHTINHDEPEPFQDQDLQLLGGHDPLL